MTDWPKFTSYDEWTTGQRRKCFVVYNLSTCHDWTHLLKRQVLIDGRAFTVTGVEAKGAAPWRSGEHISLMVE